MKPPCGRHMIKLFLNKCLLYGDILILRDTEVFDGVIGAVFTYYFKEYRRFRGYNAIMAA